MKISLRELKTIMVNTINNPNWRVELVHTILTNDKEQFYFEIVHKNSSCQFNYKTKTIDYLLLIFKEFYKLQKNVFDDKSDSISIRWNPGIHYFNNTAHQKFLNK